MYKLCTRTVICCILILCWARYAVVLAQENDPWLLGIGLQAVDNSGSRFLELFHIEENWNFSKPFKAIVEKRFAYDYGVLVGLSYNEFTIGKKINSVLNTQRITYFAMDIMLRNYTSNYWKDPRYTSTDQYLIAGWGANFFDWIINNSINIGLGTHIKIMDYTWIDLQTLAKFSIDNNTPGNANHLQHSISVVFWL